jgi:serine protease inhibitor
MEIVSIVESEKKEDSKNDNNLSIREESKLNFTVAHGVFYKKGYELTEQFKQICDNFSADVFEAEGGKEVNNFCAEKTNGKINNICGDDYGVVVATASSFKGVWKDKFSDFKENRTFLNSNNVTVLVETMSQRFLSKKYFKDENVEIISLPYKSNKLILAL